MESTKEKAIADLQKLLAEELTRWRLRQGPPTPPQSYLARVLGYASDSAVSKNLGKSKDGRLSSEFLDRVADKIPELSWLRTRYYEIKAGEKPSSASVEKAEIMKSLGQLEVEIKETVERVFKTIREMC